MPVHAMLMSNPGRLVRTALIGTFACSGWFAVASAEESSPTVNLSAKPAITLTSATTAEAKPVTTVKLAYKFQPGQFVHYSGVSRVQYISELQAEKYSSLQTNETQTHFRVVTVDEQGLALVEPVVDSTRMIAKLHDKPPVEYNSASKEEPLAEFRGIHEAIGRPVARFQVAPDGKLVKAIVIDPDAPKALRDAAERLDTRFPYLSPLPATPVSVGDKWKEEYSITILKDGLKQPIPIRRIFELVAVADGIARIKFRTVVQTPLHEAELQKQVIQQTPVGTIEFDIERGLLRSYTSTINNTVINALGPQSLLNVTGESTEKLVIADAAPTATSAVRQD